MEEVIILDLTYTEVCTLLESSTVQADSVLGKKLRAARAAFSREPKGYGNGLNFKAKEAQ